jgi:hypothetical protein
VVARLIHRLDNDNEEQSVYGCRIIDGPNNANKEQSGIHLYLVTDSLIACTITTGRKREREQAMHLSGRGIIGSLHSANKEQGDAHLYLVADLFVA